MHHFSQPLNWLTRDPSFSQIYLFILKKMVWSSAKETHTSSCLWKQSRVALVQTTRQQCMAAIRRGTFWRIHRIMNGEDPCIILVTALIFWFVFNLTFLSILVNDSNRCITVLILDKCTNLKYYTKNCPILQNTSLLTWYARA